MYGRGVMKIYTPETESVMRRYYLSLNERDRRRYAGVEALKLGHGGQNYIAKILGCSKRTVRKGAREVSELSMRAVSEKIGNLPSEPVRIRKTGGGRKPYWISHPEIDEQFLSVLRNHTAGDPMDEKVIWTNLREKEIVKALQSDHGVQVSRRVVCSAVAQKSGVQAKVLGLVVGYLEFNASAISLAFSWLLMW